MRLLVGTAIAALALLSAATVVADPPPPQPNEVRESGKAAGKVDDLDLGGGEIHFSLNGFIGPAKPADGNAELRADDGSFWSGDVTGLDVRGNEAAVEVTSRRSDGVFSRCTEIVFHLVDTGPPKPGPPPDELTGACGDRSFGGRLIHGNVVVSDAG